MSPLPSLIVPLLLILTIDLILAAAAAGLVNARFTRLLAMREQDEREIAQTTKLLDRRPQLHASLLISQMLFRFLLIGIVFVAYLPWEQTTTPFLDIAAIVIVTAVVLAFTESIINSYVLREPELWALRLTGFTRVILSILWPLLAIPLLLVRLTSDDPEKIYNVTEQELDILLDAGQQQGVIESEERQMISSIFEFHDTLTREIMVPRIDMLALNINVSVQEAMDALIASGFSRVPVYEETRDKIEGILYVKDLLPILRNGKQAASLRGLLRPAYFVPASKKVDELLAEMQEQRIHIAVVVDEYGGIAGLVTLEDIVEELVGEIQDEYDQAEEQIFQKIDDGEFIFLGRVDLDDFNTIMNSALSTDDADTLGGLIYSRIGRVPKGGETVRANDILLTVEQVSGRRIRKIRAQRVHPTTENANAHQ